MVIRRLIFFAIFALFFIVCLHLKDTTWGTKPQLEVVPFLKNFYPNQYLLKNNFIHFQTLIFMKNFLKLLLCVPVFLCLSVESYSQNPDNLTIIKPKEINDVLLNPGIGFMTFQQFNGDVRTSGENWLQGFPLDYQFVEGKDTNIDYPSTTIVYWRVYWKYLEPEMGVIRWDMIDKALEIAEKKGQTLLFRLMSYGTSDRDDVPTWYRQMVGPNRNWAYNNPVNAWMVDPEDPRYVQYFGKLIRAIGERYDGHPMLEAVDLSIIGAWGEGAGSEMLSKKTMEGLVDAYTESFKKTPLIALLMDEQTHKYANSKMAMGWRVDCIGDLGFWATEQNGWSHMYDFYAREMINCEMQDSWLHSPVSFEICGTFSTWKNRQGYGREEVKYIFDQSLKWHMASFNAKSSPVPAEWKDLVDDWLKKMGYRYALRRFTFPAEVKKNNKFEFTTWWENKGVTPCYKDFIPAIRLKSGGNEAVMVFPDVDLKKWLPGDIVFDDDFYLPINLPAGTYDIQIALVDRQKHLPRINLAIEGRLNDGWYQLGKIKVVE